MSRKKPSEHLRGFQRKAWIPRTKNKDGTLTTSKFSGKPYLAEKEKWPRCKSCKQPLQLFLQLNINELPVEFQKMANLQTGLLQLFYCTNFEDMDAKFEPYAKSVLVRIIQPKEEAGEVVIPKEISDYFPAKIITKWQEKTEYPHLEELWEMDENLTKDEELFLSSAEKGMEGDKLGGWPFWVQGPYYPRCKKCKKKMRMLFQLDSNKNLPFMFGDAGMGHIYQCPKHTDILAFGWACY